MAAPPRRLVALLSGGMDSAVAAAVAARDAEVHALAFEYGQRQGAEVDAAREVARRLDLASFDCLRVDLGRLGGSALTSEMEVPKDREGAEIGADIPVTYVPARNTVFLALALAAAEVQDADGIVIGANRVDYSGYPDCRPAFLEAFETVARLGTRRGVEGRPFRILAPLLDDSKATIVRRGVELGVPFEFTLSCYDPVTADEGIRHCGRCDACRLRRRGFEEAGVPDPTAYDTGGPA